MGLRSIIILNNDKAHLWSEDKSLGRKIMDSINNIDTNPHVEDYGKVVQCVHVDQQTLAYIHKKDVFIPVSVGLDCGNSHEDEILDLVRKTAKSLGYRLIKE